MIDTHLNTHDKNPPHRLSDAGILWLLFLAPTLYVLSFGPAVWLHERGVVSTETVITWYTPVEWLHDHTFLEKPLQWYSSLWL